METTHITTLQDQDIRRPQGGFEVQMDNVSYGIPGKRGRLILNKVSLKIPSGQFVAIVGTNGAGKTSLLRAIAGELDYPATGSVSIAGADITRPVVNTIDGVGIVHQQEELDLIQHLSVGHNIAIRQMLGRARKRSSLLAMGESWKSDVRSTLGRKANICTLPLETIVSELAGGERQILSVVIAVHFEHADSPCGLLLLDEHTCRLDHRNAAFVMKYTVDQIRESRLTAIMVTHRYVDAIEHADRIVVMKEGSVSRDINDVDEVRGLTIQTLAEYVEH